ncbi:outer membrane beta-barrel protein [Pedobacter antarcticus]|uniref:outer membrane beta-barrel protein n=1 Tax=Pedobacter antarcticus TaxID=34086 RepID=UPI0008888A94|nr:outer membrane beta-barrel protein [Pedobacter antarcticus]SDM17873.1 Outer membrane protein beta-barrel domain-containing protein [Pedobacter antarcticus]
MIKKLLLIALMCCSTFAFAQKDGDAKISLGVRGYNYTELPQLFNQAKDHQFINTKFNSYIIKFNDGLFSYRLNGNYINKSLQFDNNCTGCDLTSGKVKDYAFKAGFEKNFSYTGIQPYFAFDLGYRSTEFNGRGFQAERVPSAVDFRKRGITVTPVLGIKISPIKELSIFAESNMEFFYAFGKERSTADGADQPTNSHKFKKGEFLLNPVAVGVQFHFR